MGPPGRGTSLCYTWFHTCFVADLTYTATHAQLDKVGTWLLLNPWTHGHEASSVQCIHMAFVHIVWAAGNRL